MGQSKYVAFVNFPVFADEQPQAQAQQPVYRFSPVNQWDIPKTAAYWNPIIQYVSQQSGVQLELKIGRTSADTTAYVLAQEVEFVFSNHLFSPERDKLGWKVFGRRTGALQGQIAVLDNSPIRTLEELSKQDMVFAGPEAFIGYRVPQPNDESRNRGECSICGQPERGIFSIVGRQSKSSGQQFGFDRWFHRKAGHQIPGALDVGVLPGFGFDGFWQGEHKRCTCRHQRFYQYAQKQSRCIDSQAGLRVGGYGSEQPLPACL